MSFPGVGWGQFKSSCLFGFLASVKTLSEAFQLLLISSNHHFQVVPVAVLISLMRKLRHRKVTWPGNK
jgi:hypothetical protein